MDFLSKLLSVHFSISDEKTAGSADISEEKTAGRTNISEEKTAGRTDISEEKTAGRTDISEEKTAVLHLYYIIGRAGHRSLRSSAGRRRLWGRSVVLHLYYAIGPHMAVG